MNPEQIRELLGRVSSGELDVEAAMDRLRLLPYEEIGFAKVDHHRHLRKGFPEVVLCQGKTAEQVAEIVQRLLPPAGVVLATRAGEDVFAAVQKVTGKARYHPLPKLIVVGDMPEVTVEDPVLVVTAGTADIPVAEEASVTAEAMGNRVERLYDVGVAGLHRLLDHSKELLESNVIVVVAGMEGALASIVSGMVDKPVIAVPTSVGYGASFQGLAALLGMLNTCAPGLAVVNIDNGFGAGYMAGLINRRTGRKR